MHDRKKKKHAPLSPEEQRKRDEEYQYIGGLYTKLIQENRRYTTSRTALGDDNNSHSHNHHAEDRGATLHEIECLLLRVPEAYSMYNYRRTIILDEIGELAAGGDEEKNEEANFAHRRDLTIAMLKRELKLNTEILKNDFKVYAAFSYRNWVLNLWIQLAVEEGERQRKTPSTTVETGEGEGASSPSPPAAATNHHLNSNHNNNTNIALDSLLHMLSKEQQQCQLLLSLDARNFHMWNYRRSVLQRIEKVLCLRPPSPAGGGGSAPAATEASFFLPEEAEEIQFTTKEIKSNFSNYSAWHQRGYTIKKALVRHGFQLQRPHRGLAGDAAAKPALPDAFARTLYALVVEDLFLFTQSIFCDPNDQSSFCYATFSLTMFLTFEDELRRQHAQQPAQTATESEEIDALLKANEGDIMDCFVEGVVNVVTEQIALDESASCSLSLFFLLQLLIQLTKAQREHKASADEAGARLARYVHKIYTRIMKRPTAADGVDGPAERKETVAWLQQQLIQGDPLRRGMYEEITKYM